MKKATIAKSYKRKVNLSFIEEPYDHIEFSTFISKEIEYEDDQDILDHLPKLTDMVIDEVEADIVKTFVRIVDMLKDEDNSALVGASDKFEMYDSIKGITIQKDNKLITEDKSKKESKKESKEDNDDDLSDILGESDKDEGEKKKVWAEENKDKKPEEVDLDDFNPDDYMDL